MPARSSTKRKKTATKKRSITSSKNQRGRKNGAAQKQRKEDHQRAAIFLMAAAILLAALTFVQGADAWQAVHKLLFGLLGPITYLLFPLCVYVSIAIAMDKPLVSIRRRLIETLLVLLFVCGIIHIAVFDSPPRLDVLYESGIQKSSGGLIGGILGVPFELLLGRVGGIITLTVFTTVDIFLLTGLTILNIITALESAKKRRLEYHEERELQMAEMPIDGQASKRRKKHAMNIDIPLEPKVDSAGENVNAKKMEKQPPSNSEKSASTLDELVGKIAKLRGKNHDAQSSAKMDIPPIVNKEDEVPWKEEPDQELLGVQQPRESSLSSVMQDNQDNSEKVDSSPKPSLQTSVSESHPYQYPPVDLLQEGKPVNTEGMEQELKENASTLVDTLRSFGVETRITDISRGPTVTRYEIQPSAGVKISRITSLADDIALNLAAAGVRIEAPIPNKAAVGVEVPNKQVSIVHIRQILESQEFIGAQSKLSVALGYDIAGNSTVTDVSKMPHLLIAGATGSGKSVCINSIIVSLLYKSTPEEVRFLMIDPKVVELGVYNGIPHLLVPVVTDPRKAAGALGWAVSEMQNRYKAFADNNVRDLRGYNQLASKTEELETMPQMVIIIDELSDLMMVASKEVEDALLRLAQMARAAGMHLVIATQRPSVDVITGVIKANIPSRIAFAVSSQVDSRTILDGGGAEKLLGRGDMLFLPIGASKPVRVQGCFVSDEEVETVVEHVKQNATPDYDESVLDEIDKQAAKENNTDKNTNGDADVMLPKAIECVVNSGTASTSLLQRRLKLGYARAARIVDEMEARGIVGPSEGSKPRKVLISRQQWIEMSVNQTDD